MSCTFSSFLLSPHNFDCVIDLLIFSHSSLTSWICVDGRGYFFICITQILQRYAINQEWYAAKHTANMQCSLLDTEPTDIVWRRQPYGLHHRSPPSDENWNISLSLMFSGPLVTSSLFCPICYIPVSYWLCKVPLQRSAWQRHLNKYIFNNNNNNNNWRRRCWWNVCGGRTCWRNCGTMKRTSERDSWIDRRDTAPSTVNRWASFRWAQVSVSLSCAIIYTENDLTHLLLLCKNTTEDYEFTYLWRHMSVCSDQIFHCSVCSRVSGSLYLSLKPKSKTLGLKPKLNLNG